MRNLSEFSRNFCRRRNALLTGLTAALLLSASTCSSGDPAATFPPGAAPPGLRLVLDRAPAPPSDTIEVFVCAVPLDTTDPIYGTMTLRLDLDPATLAHQLSAGVTPYFEELSHGAYTPRFIAGSTLALSMHETHDACVERALDASDRSATTVLAIATAEHLATAPGGWGRPGEPCATAPCPAAATRRAAYIGASDFHPDNGSVPLLDLVEHEIGHTLDLPHSGDEDNEHASALDVMSNSAAPRVVQPQRKDAQDTLAIDRLALGWLPAEAVTVAGPAGGTFDLAPSAGTSGLRLLVLPVDDLRFLTVEYLAASGLDDFLPAGGTAVHLIDPTPATCARAEASTTPSDAACTGVDRRQITLGSGPPHTDLLTAPGQTWHLDGWDIAVRRSATANDGEMQLAVTPTDR